MTTALLTIIFALGIITSYEDYKFYKIKNKWLLIAFFLGLFILFLNFNLSYFGKVFLNFLFASIVSFLMWKKNVWAAGDAKLFIVYCFLIPLTFFNNYYLYLFPPIILLINIFTIVLFYLFINSIFFIFYKNNSPFTFLKKLKYEPQKIYFILNIFIIFLLFFVSFDLLNYLSINHFGFNTVFLKNLFFIFFILFTPYFFKVFINNKKFRVIILIVLSSFVFLGLFLNFSLIIQSIIKTFLMFLVSLVIFMIIQRSINLYILAKESKKIKIKDLKKGMNIDKKEIKEIGLSDLVINYPEGLSSTHIEIIRKRAKEIDKKFINIYPSFPFAFWIFIGVLVTLLIKGSIIDYLFAYNLI